MSPTDKIEQLLVRKPGLRAQQIADELGLNRPQVVATLHGLSGIAQDNTYRWWPQTQPAAAPGAAPAPRTLLANLCRYYLECLSRESGPAISFPASETSGYVELAGFPLTGQTDQTPEARQAILKLSRKVQRDRGQLTLYIGYGIRLRSIRSKQEEEMRIEPVLLYPVDDVPDHSNLTLRPASGVPLFNLEVLKNHLSADSGNLMDEALQLSEELGLASGEDELPPWDEIILRLERCRPDWEWREHLDPWTLSQGSPLSEIGAPGIYNRAVLFAGTRSPFTYGLEVELRKLIAAEAGDGFRGTALGQWLNGAQSDRTPSEDRPILEVLPLNSEQRQAVLQGLGAPLTVVTGPPGTGKSQVVTALLTNVAWQGGSVLFSSKNNHAVDVVESRINEPGTYPLLLRLGKEEHHARIAQDLTARLADSSGPEDAARYARLVETHQRDCARYAAVQKDIAAVVGLRNAVDGLERAAEPARALFGPERFASFRTLDLDSIGRRIESFTAAIRAQNEPIQPGMIRSLLDSGKPARSRRVAEAAAGLASDAELLGITPREQNEPESWAGRLAQARRAQAYWRAFDQLRAAPSLGDLAREQARIAEESARDSRELWHCWLRLWPGRWNHEERRLLSEYVSLLQMIAGGARGAAASSIGEATGRKVFRRYYSLFPRVTKMLPCWSVTSLSARGRLPFEPGLFDLVVIDEASQCDIASALPLLFRARRAVIIGDPLQLKHVSTVAPRQDRLILEAHGLADNHAAWAYSVNSLFDLARSLCRYEDIVNLRDHHRSHRDIIGFSNRHFYRGRLRIATDHGTLRTANGAGPAVHWVDLKGKVFRPSGGGALNPPEAAAVLAELRTLVLERGYSGTIGVVTPFRAHANRIRTLLHQDPELSQRLAALQLVVDTVHGFQGDERDLIVFSPVVSLGAGENMLRFLNGNGNLFNVAITRARSELLVVGDRQAALDSGVSYLAAFAEYSRGLTLNDERVPVAGHAGPDYPLVAHPELVSEWERAFYGTMYAAGLRPIPQYDEAPYTLDFALFDGERKLDIEIDGENYHRDWDGELCRRDQIRSRRLGDLGWEILRFWVYEIRDDPEGSIGKVKGWMKGR